MGKRLTAGALLLLSVRLGGACAIRSTFAETPAGHEARAANGAVPAELAAGHVAAAAAARLAVRPGPAHAGERSADGDEGLRLSVFKGTKIERFDVEVLSVLKNFNPKYDVVLITCKGANLEHTGAIAGMSGSPVYLKDDQRRERMIGAFAYGWPLTKDPIAGVQPIEYMLTLPGESSARPGSCGPADHRPAGAADGAGGPAEARQRRGPRHSAAATSPCVWSWADGEGPAGTGPGGRRSGRWDAPDGHAVRRFGARPPGCNRSRRR